MRLGREGEKNEGTTKGAWKASKELNIMIKSEEGRERVERQSAQEMQDLFKTMEARLREDQMQEQNSKCNNSALTKKFHQGTNSTDHSI